MVSGSLWGNPDIAWNGDGKGRMANAPPPDAFQLTLMYCYNRWPSAPLREQSQITNAYPRSRDNISVPCTIRHFDVLYSMFLLRRLPKDVAKMMPMSQIRPSELAEITLTDILRPERNETWLRGVKQERNEENAEDDNGWVNAR